MSATNRGGKREPLDNYPTPAWCVRRLLEAVDLPCGDWLEPAAGDGAIIRAVNCHFREMPIEPTWTGVEVRNVPPFSYDAHYILGDFLTHDFGGRRFDVAISNPPYCRAQEFIEKCIAISDVTAMLLRLNYLGSETRSEFMRAHPPAIYALPNRPKFVNGKSDSCEYGWFVWGLGDSRVRVLADTPLAERRSA